MCVPAPLCSFFCMLCGFVCPSACTEGVCLSAGVSVSECLSVFLFLRVIWVCISACTECVRGVHVCDSGGGTPGRLCRSCMRVCAAGVRARCVRAWVWRVLPQPGSFGARQSPGRHPGGAAGGEERTAGARGGGGGRGPGTPLGPARGQRCPAPPRTFLSRDGPPAARRISIPGRCRGRLNMLPALERHLLHADPRPPKSAWSRRVRVTVVLLAGKGVVFQTAGLQRPPWMAFYVSF